MDRVPHPSNGQGSSVIDCGRTGSGSFLDPLLQCMDGYLFVGTSIQNNFEINPTAQWAPRAPKAPFPGGPKGPLGPRDPKGPLAPWPLWSPWSLGPFGPWPPLGGGLGVGSPPGCEHSHGSKKAALRKNCATSKHGTYVFGVT